MLKEILEKLNEETEYQKFFKGKLKKYGVKSPSELDKEDRKKFFDEVDKDWDGEDS